MSTATGSNAHAVKLLEFISILCNPANERSKRDLNKLTVAERKRVFEDLSGNREQVEENRDDLAEAVRQMTDILSSRKDKPAFEMARNQDSDYALNKDFLLMFLRANDYDPKISAEMVFAHFEEKLNLFGEDKLTKPIELSDLSADDMHSLESGGFQISSSKDTAGRTIAFFRMAAYRWKTVDNWARSSWYIWMTTLQDEDVQLKGIVGVAFELGDTPPRFDFELVRREMYKLRCIPVRVAGSHFCTGCQTLLTVFDLLSHMATPFFRVRARVHCGIETEILYQLMTFGIPVHAIPWVAGGSKYHERWIEERRRLESCSFEYMDEDYDDSFTMDDDEVDPSSGS